MKKHRFENKDFRTVAECIIANCLQVAKKDGEVAIRSSLRPKNVAIFTKEEWEAFVNTVKKGRI